MTDDIAKLRDAVIEAAKRLQYTIMPTELFNAVSAIRTAEEAARKPRLRTPVELIDQERRKFNYQLPLELTEAIRARDAEWLAAIRALPADHAHNMRSNGHLELSDARVRLADIEALAEGAKR